MWEMACKAHFTEVFQYDKSQSDNWKWVYGFLSRYAIRFFDYINTELMDEEISK